MKCKTDKIRTAWAAGDRLGALRIAARFFDRSPDTLTFKRGIDAHNNPGFYREAAGTAAAGGLTMKAIFWALAIGERADGKPGSGGRLQREPLSAVMQGRGKPAVGSNSPITMVECMGIVEALSQVLPYLDRKFNCVCAKRR